ncbi:MAG: PRC-barrel domain-containing protein [Chthoniobacteraceae bacterium]
MLQDIKQLYGRKLGATDGDIGHVKDFYFDDATWTIRYLVADTGDWLAERQVLLSTHAFGTPAYGATDADSDLLHTNQTRKQIEDSPPIDTHLPVSRQYEEAYHRYYGWPPYWQVGGMLSTAGFATIPPPPLPGDLPHHGHNQREDLHLRSTKALTGYHIQATDGKIGSVSSFIVNEQDWRIRELVIETGHWYAGKTILLFPEAITRISYEDSTVFVNLAMEDIRQTAKHGIALATAGDHTLEGNDK